MRPAGRERRCGRCYHSRPMRLPGAPSLFFLAYLLLFLPWVAFRSARRLRPADALRPQALPVSRERLWGGTLAAQLALFLITWVTGRTFGYRIFAVKTIGVREILAALAALAVCLALRGVSRAVRSEEERRAMAVYRIAPRAPREWALWTATVLVGSVAEEAAYRGLGTSILWYSLGNPWAAAAASAAAFALAHSLQGWKSALTIFALALVMQGLVALTGTLVLAMAVHAAYDLLAGYRIAREARGWDHEPAAAVPAVPEPR